MGWLLPEDLQQGEGPAARQARLLVRLWALFTFLIMGAAAISILLRGVNPLAAILFGGGVLNFGVVFLVRRRSIDLASAWFLGVNLIAVTLVAWQGYGPLSPASQAFILLPTVGIILGGARLGVPTGGLALLQILALVLADRLGHTFPLEPSGDRFVLVHALVLGMTLILLMVFLGFYDWAWRQASAASELARAELARTDQAKSRFLASMSHELRTPLTTIVGYTDMLREDCTPQQDQDLQRIHQSSTLLVSLVNDLLDLAKIEAGRVELERLPTNLEALVSDVVDAAGTLAAKRNNTLHAEVPAQMMINTDARRLHQVLLNLVSNACKFTEQGLIRVEARRSQGGVLLLVSDTGVGMSAAEAAACFEPFEQGDAGKKQGTGLGLAISRELVALMGGTIEVRSEPDVGTTFELTLP